MEDGQGLGGGIGIIDRANKTFHIFNLESWQF